MSAQACPKCGTMLYLDSGVESPEPPFVVHGLRRCGDVLRAKLDEAVKALEAVSGICFRITAGEISAVARQHAIAIGGVANDALERLRDGR